MQIHEFTDFSNDAEVRIIIREYIDALPFDISYQNFENELGDLASLYSEKVRGSLFIAEENGKLAGCVALKKLNDANCEMKRLYVRQQWKGKKIGSSLAEKIIERAIKLGYSKMNLDTDVNAHKTAIALYKNLGFQEVPAYHEIPHQLLFMELDLTHYKNQRKMNSIVSSPIHKKISDDLFIIEFETEHRKAFKDLNVAWITKSFVMEESDEMVLSNPEEHFLNNGGAILLARYKNEIVGTCALTYEGHGIYELTKMAVDENLRGLKIGYHLGVATLEKAKQLGAKKVILHSNRKGSAAAINLYLKLGFVEIPLDDAPWARADIKMEIKIK